MAYNYTPKYPALAYTLTAKAQKGVTFKSMATEVGGGSGDIVTSERELLDDIQSIIWIISEDSANVATILGVGETDSDSAEEKKRWVVKAGALECGINALAVYSMVDLMLTKAYSKQQLKGSLNHLIDMCNRSTEMVNSILKELSNERSEEENLVYKRVKGIPTELKKVVEYADGIKLRNDLS